mgnify:FL=1
MAFPPMYRRQLGLETVRRATTRDELSPVRWDATKAYDPGWGGHGCLIGTAADAMQTFMDFSPGDCWAMRCRIR